MFGWLFGGGGGSSTTTTTTTNTTNVTASPEIAVATPVSVNVDMGSVDAALANIAGIETANLQATQQSVQAQSDSNKVQILIGVAGLIGFVVFSHPAVLKKLFHRVGSLAHG